MNDDPDLIAGRYEVLGRLGQGGMGVVYRARDRLLQRVVALKMTRDPVTDAHDRERFIREARSAAALNHSNIVAVHDFGDDEARPFIVMELVEGATLGALIRQAYPLTIPQRLRHLRAVCAGLEHAHSRDVLHLDIKPSNVIVDSSQVPKILDFGIARLAGQGTQTAVVGTLNYMAPEQLTGRVDKRTDVFGMGTLIYELMTGLPAFPGSAQDGLLDRIQRAAYRPLPEAILVRVPGLEAIVVRTIARDPRDRYQTMEELGAAVDEACRSVDESVDELATTMTLRDTPLPGVGAGAPAVATAVTVPELRTRLFIAGSPSELRRLKYEVEQYLAIHPHDVEGRLLNDDVARALSGGVAREAVARLTVPTHATPSSRSRWSRYATLSTFFSVISVGVVAGAVAWRLNLRHPATPPSQPPARQVAAQPPSPPPPAPMPAPPPDAAMSERTHDEEVAALLARARAALDRKELPAARAQVTTVLSQDPANLAARRLLARINQADRSQASEVAAAQRQAPTPAETVAPATSPAPPAPQMVTPSPPAMAVRPAQPPTSISNIRFERVGTVFTILYDLSSNDDSAVYKIALEVSLDRGQTFSFTPTAVSGDIGEGVKPGKDRKIVWQTSRDTDLRDFDLFRFKPVVVPVTGRTN